MTIDVVKQYPIPEFTTIEGAQEWARNLNRVLTEGDYSFSEKLQKEIGGIKSRAYLSAQQDNIADSTHTIIELDTESYDVGSNFNTTTYRFTAPIDGYYGYSYAARFTNIVADKRYQAGVYKNAAGSPGSGNVISLFSAHASLVDFITVSHSDIQYLDANDYIELGVYHEAGVGTVDVVGNKYTTYLAVHLLSR